MLVAVVVVFFFWHGSSADSRILHFGIFLTITFLLGLPLFGSDKSVLDNRLLRLLDDLLYLGMSSDTFLSFTNWYMAGACSTVSKVPK